MPTGHLTNAAAGSTARLAKKEKPATKEGITGGKDFAFFIPFFLTEKKSGKNNAGARNDKRH